MGARDICQCTHVRSAHGPAGDYTKPPQPTAKCQIAGCVCGRFHPASKKKAK